MKTVALFIDNIDYTKKLPIINKVNLQREIGRITDTSSFDQYLSQNIFITATGIDSDAVIETIVSGTEIPADIITDFTKEQMFELLISPEQEKHIGPLFESERKQLNNSLLTIENLISLYEQFPISYNQVVMMGTLDYCSNLLNKIQDTTYTFENIMVKIQRYVDLLKSLKMQFQDKAELFFKIDLTYVENVFEGIEQAAVKSGLLPKLENMSI